MAKPFSEITYKDGKLFWTTGSRTGKEAGSKRKDGYRKVEYKGKCWLTHRLIWYICTGEVVETLDHVNGIRDDNRVENLRPCTKSQNASNTPKCKGVLKGVSAHQGKFRSTISYSGKTLNLKSGCTELEAAMIYNINAEKLFGEFASFNKVFIDKEGVND